VQQPTLIAHYKFSKIQCSENHSIALDLTGKVYAWGEDESGACGPRFDIKYQPHQMLFKDNDDGFRKIVDYSCGPTHSSFVTSSGELFSCGWNNFGQLGIGFVYDIEYLAHQVVFKSFIPKSVQ